MDVISGATLGYQGPMYAVAGDYPGTVSEHATGCRTREDVDHYMGHIYESRYLAG